MNDLFPVEHVLLAVVACVLFVFVGPGEPFYYDGPQTHLTAVKWMDKE